MAMLSWLVSWCSEFVTLARSILRYHCEFESQYRYTHRTCGNQSQGGIFLDGQFASKSSLKCSNDNMWSSGYRDPSVAQISNVQCLSGNFQCCQGTVPKLEIDLNLTQMAIYLVK
jgi:hypothetical protein